MQVVQLYTSWDKQYRVPAERPTFFFKLSTLSIILSMDFSVSSAFKDPELEGELKLFAIVWTLFISRSMFFWDVLNIFR